MKKVTINLYSFSELSQRAKEVAVQEHLEFMDSIPEDYENEDGVMVEEYVEHTEEDAIESIEINEYLFFEDGTLASCTTYTGKHPKAGITELKLHGSIYTV